MNGHLFEKYRVVKLILVAMGLIFVGRALVNLIRSMDGDVNLPLPDIWVNIADMIICTLWIISGILLFSKKRSTYIAGMISYLHGSLLFLSLIIFMAIKPLLCGTEFIAADLFVIGIMVWYFLFPVFSLCGSFLWDGRKINNGMVRLIAYSLL